MKIFFAILALIFFTLWIIARKKLKALQSQINVSSVENAEDIRKLKESKERYKAIVEHMNEAVAAVDDDLRIAYFNQPFLKMFSPDHPIDEKMSFMEVVRNTQLNALVKAAFDTKRTEKELLEFTGAENVRTSEVQAVYIPFKQKSMVALVFYDLTKIKETERMKRDFITNASHQLKTPLTAIQGYAETLIEDSDMDLKTRSDFLRKIQIKSLETADLVFKMLRLSKLESNVDEIQGVNIDIDKMIKDLERKFEGNLKKHQIELIHQTGNEPVQIQTDLSMFQLILENLLENAVKYSKPHGKIYVSTMQQDGKIKLDIRDEGIGIPQADQRRIFERFFRSHNAEHHTHDGVGIGMAIVKSALLKIKGTLEIDSHQNEGTTMHLSFPRRL